jgi:hypothetical protein
MFTIGSIAVVRGAALARGRCADLRRQISALGTDRSGNVTRIFAIAVVPPAGAGAAALDAIALVMSRQAPISRTTAA